MTTIDIRKIGHQNKYMTTGRVKQRMLYWWVETASNGKSGFDCSHSVKQAASRGTLLDLSTVHTRTRVFDL